LQGQQIGFGIQQAIGIAFPPDFHLTAYTKRAASPAALFFWETQNMTDMMTKPPEKPKLPPGGFRTSDGRVIVNRATGTFRPPDTARVGSRSLGEAINILTNETNGLSGGPSGELAAAKFALAHTIQNGLRQPRPPQVAPFTLSDEAGSSIGRNDDIDVMQQVHIAKESGRSDPVNGAVYFGTSPSLITSRRIGSGRQDVLQRFGPFDHGSGPKQYVYIYGKPYIAKGN
jgi:hypothetical protein